MVYDFGWPDELLDIHFPHASKTPPPNTSYPWYYYLEQQTPTYFQFIGSAFGGHGWQASQNLPVIKILPIDTQKYPNPTSQVGFGSLEEAIDRTNNGEPIDTSAWGRFHFTSPLFWDVLGLEVPTWASFAKGLPTQRLKDPHRPIQYYIKDAVTHWLDYWNTGASNFNAAANGVDGLGNYTVLANNGGFTMPPPPPNATIPQLQQHLGRRLKDDGWYFGPLPPTYVFATGYAKIFKQSFSFRYRVAQLDPTEWDMSTLPPRRVSNSLFAGGSRHQSSFVTGNFGGYNPDIPFPQNPPIIV